MTFIPGQRQNYVPENITEGSAPRGSSRANLIGQPPAGPAGGVLAGYYPNPSFKEDMATAADLAALGRIPGLDGEDGAECFQYPPGMNGVAGRDGLTVPGRDGEDGEPTLVIPGPPGLNGRDGLTIPGYDGEDGQETPGTAGTNGTNGRDGLTIPGFDGADGEDAFPIPCSVQGAKGEPGQFMPAFDGEDGQDCFPIQSVVPGIQGIPGVGIPGFDGEDGEYAPIIIGQPGLPGIAGLTIPGYDGEDGESALVIPGEQGPPGIDGLNGTQPDALLRLLSYAFGRIKFLETVLAIEYKDRDITVPEEVALLDGLGYLPTGIEGVV